MYTTPDMVLLEISQYIDSYDEGNLGPVDCCKNIRSLLSKYYRQELV